MQLMHADAVFRGGALQWAHFLDPSPEDWQRFESAADRATSEHDDWLKLEPNFSP
jgi:hypothetical protein